MKELDFLLNICSEISTFIQKNYYEAQVKFLKQYEHTNISGDLQKGIDELVNNKIIDSIRKQGFSVIIISEETGIIKTGLNPEYFLVLDPIDGSNNVRKCFTPSPHLSISMALGKITDLMVKGIDSIFISVVKEIFTDNTYYAIKDRGVFFKNRFNQYKLKVSQITSIKDSPIIGIDLDKKRSCEDYLIDLISRKILVRRLGSSILDLCQVASGQYDAYISLGKRLKLTDICQPYVLIKTAGGYMEYFPFLNNEMHKNNFLIECIENPDILGKIRFNIIAAGTSDLLLEIKNVFNL